MSSEQRFRTGCVYVYIKAFLITRLSTYLCHSSDWLLKINVTNSKEWPIPFSLYGRHLDSLKHTVKTGSVHALFTSQNTLGSLVKA